MIKFFAFILGLIAVSSDAGFRFVEWLVKHQIIFPIAIGFLSCTILLLIYWLIIEVHNGKRVS